MKKETTKSAVIFGCDELAYNAIIRNRMRHTITNLISDENVTNFYFTRYNKFDMFYWENINNLQQFFPKITKTLVLEKTNMQCEPKNYPNVPFKQYENFAYVYTQNYNLEKEKYIRSLKAIDESDFVIFTATIINGNLTYNQPEFGYANKLNKKIIVII